MEEAASGSSSSESRIVRCPDCGNVLPELPDFSVSLCGSCGAVLRAKWKGHVKGGLSDIADDGKGRVVASKGGIAMSSNNVSETEANRKLELGNCSTSSRSENGDFLSDSTRSGKRNPISVRTRVEKSIRDRLRDRDEYGSSKDELDLDDWACRNDVQMDIGDGEYVDSNVEIRPRVGPHGSRIVNEKWGGERNVWLGTRGNAMDVARQKRGMNFGPLEEGSLEYVMRSSYGAGDYRRYHDGFNGFTRVAGLENDRAELLRRRIDELKDQLSQTCDVAENPKERIGIEPRMGSMPFDPYRSHDVYRQGLFGPRDQGHRVLGPPYIYDVGEDVPYKGSIVQDSYSVPRHRHGKVQYDNAYYEQVNTRAYQPYPYFPQMYHNDYPDPYMDVNSHPLRLHPHKSPFHRPACSCSQCFNQNPKVPPVIRSHDPANSILYQQEISAAHNQQWHRRGLGGHAREKFDIGHQSPPRKVNIAHGCGQVCRAISGGAPFITCHNCFELLKLPWKVGMMGKNQKKIRCGSCSSIMLYELSGKGITFSVPKQIAKLSAELADGSGDMPNESFESSHGSMNPCSNYEFAGSKVEPLPANLKSSSDESGKRQGARSLSSSFSENEKNPEVMVGKDDSLSVGLPSKDDVPLPPSKSPLHHNYVSSDDVGDGYIMVTKWSSQNEGQQNSMKDDAPVETVMDISINESINSSVSQEFFAGLVKNSTEELSKSSQNSEDRRSNVFVNGQLIPACEVKRAEDLAGPIQIGDYWYDVRAGFWGVMGHHCLGIVPPNIPEFNFPMPKKCSAGNTGVFVNGRELHQKDLNLLSSRGLPITKNKSYLIEISGKVTDEQTGEELDSLGKLAPTVERAKHGFGMKVPKYIAEQSYY